MSAQIRGAFTVTVMGLAIAGCSPTGGSSTGPASYWLVRVQGNYANVYRYPQATPPGRSGDRSQAVYLGPTIGDARAHLSAAAREMGVPRPNITFVS